MQRQRFSRRFLAPVVTVLLLMILTYVVHDLAQWTGHGILYRVLCHVFGPLFFLVLVFGTFYVYPKAYALGAGAGERVLACLVGPVAWMSKEVVAVSRVYTWPEALYYYVNPVHVLLLSVLAAEMGLCEVICRKRWKKTFASPPRVPRTALLALILGLASVAFMFAWDFGVHHFYLFQEGYKAIWGYGV